jgi:hypothetical protein
LPRGLIQTSSSGNRFRFATIANNMADAVKMPKKIVGMKLDNTRIENPAAMMIDV